MLELKNVTKRYKNNKGIYNISFKAENGSIVGIVGANGSGKSTLLSCISHGNCSGKINFYFNNFVYNPYMPEFFEYLGVVSSRFGFPVHYNAKIVCKILSMIYKRWSIEKFHSLLEYFELDNNLRIKAYSTGMKHKLAISIAMAASPQLLIFDEATKSLDNNTVRKFKDIILKLKNEGKLILFVSHVREEIEDLCDSIVLIHEGKLVFSGSISDYRQIYDGERREFL